MTADLTNSIFTDEDAARKHFEAIRWPNGPVCPHCGVSDRVRSFDGKSMGTGWYHCNDCRKKFTATMGTLYERSHIPLHKWLLATHLMASSKKGISAYQLYRMLGFGSYRTAWFMAHRIREGMRQLSPESAGPLGGEGKVVETYVGGKEKNKHASKRKHLGTGDAGKEAVFSLIERRGRVRSHHVPSVTAKNLKPIIKEQIDAATSVITDGGTVTKALGREFAKGGSVNHSIGEYMRGDVHTNIIEGYFSIFKRGIIGTYHHFLGQHLKRYLAEFDFRYNSRSALGIEDAERARNAVGGVIGRQAHDLSTS